MRPRHTLLWLSSSNGLVFLLALVIVATAMVLNVRAVCDAATS